MANTYLINTQGHGSHLSVAAGGDLAIAVGPANDAQHWQLHFVPERNNVFRIQHVNDGRYIQIAENGVNLVAEGGNNCELTLDNGIGNNTTISNRSLDQTLMMHIQGNQVVTGPVANAAAWSFIEQQI